VGLDAQEDPMLLGLALGLARRNALGSGCPARRNALGPDPAALDLVV